MVSLGFEHLSIASKPDKRSEAEEKWVTFQPYLLSKGYLLRPRYQPDWVPSWKDAGRSPALCEDALDRMPKRVLDAIRMQDEQRVIIKTVIPTEQDKGKDEHATLQYFSRPPLKEDPFNHVVPLIDSFPIPGIDSGYFIVMPLLSSYIDRVPFYNLAEVHDCLKQLFDGVLFMHNNNVAHCDIASPNILMDAHPLYNELFHPAFQTLSMDVQRRVYPRYRRSEKTIRYYFISLGNAKSFYGSNLLRTATGMDARVSAPEQMANRSYNPFAVDVYQLGAMIKQDCVDKYDQLRFILPLIEEMTRRDPTNRPKIEAARASMNTAFLGLSGWRYRQPLVTKKDNSITQWLAFFAGVLEELKYIMGRVLDILLRFD